MFTRDLERRSGMLPAHVAMGLAELIAAGAITCDSFGGLRRLITPPSRRRGVMKRAFALSGRWSRLAHRGRLRARLNRPRAVSCGEAAPGALRVVFRRVLDRERIPVPWGSFGSIGSGAARRRAGRAIRAAFRGRAVRAPEAVEPMRRLRRERAEAGQGPVVSRPIPQPDGIPPRAARASSQARRQVLVA
jgi:ATP-dependent Lhr-like helicase